MWLWVDDERVAPSQEWLVARKYDGAVAFIHIYADRLQKISLDHDLGDKQERNGYHLLCLIEEMLYTGELQKLPEILIHTANPSAHEKMVLVVNRLKDKFGR